MYNFCPNCGTQNLHDKQNFTCIKCKKSFFTNSKPTSSIIPIYKNEILLGIRALDPAKGKYDIIGGYLNNNEDPIVGGLRELKEETGILCNPLDLKLFKIVVANDYEYQGEIISTINIIYIVEFDSKPKMTAGDDIKRLEWVKVDAELDFAFGYYHALQQDLKAKILK